MTLPNLDRNTPLRFVNSFEEAQILMEWFRNDRGRSCIAIDTETGGLDQHHDALRLVQVGDKHAGFAIPWAQWGGLFKEVLNKWDGVVALHNAQFDLRFLEREKVWKPDWSRLADTMIMARIMRPGKPAGLKPLSVELVDPQANAGQNLLKKAMADNDWTWATVPVELPVYHMYGALDTVETAWLYDIFRADLAFPKVWDLEMATLRVCYNMEKRGFAVDLDYAQKKFDELHRFAEESRKWGKDNLGISIGSPGALIKFFQGEGAVITEKTPAGGPSMNADQLEIFTRHENPRVKKVAEVALNARKAEKLANTYFKAILEKSVNGRIHPDINTLGAKTGRMSGSNPNLQNLPSRSGSIVKNAYVPDEGQVLLSSDLDQVEFRLTACFAEDAGLIGLFNDADAGGGDVFTQIGRTLYNDPSMQKSDPRRATVKTYIYSRLYGATIGKQAASAGVTYEVMEGVAEAFDQAYPGVAFFQNSTIAQIEARARQSGGEGWIESPVTGRTVPVERGAAYRGVNYFVQCSAAEVMKQNLIKIDAAGLGDAMRIPVHDEIILSVDQADVAEAQQTVTECMTNRTDFALPLTADCSGALARWGSKYD